MKTFFSAVLLAFMIGGCADSAIEAVKTKKISENQTVNDFIGLVAGPSGSVSWSSGHAPGEPWQTKYVTATVSRKTEGKERSATIQWVVNKDSQYVELGAIEIDGIPHNKLSGLVALSEFSFGGVEQNESDMVDGVGECVKAGKSGVCAIYKIGGLYKIANDDGSFTFSNTMPK